MAVHIPTTHASLTAAVHDHEQRRDHRTSYTDDQWAAIQQLHRAFGLDPDSTKAIALVGGQPLLAVVRVSAVRTHPVTGRGIADAMVVEC